MNLPTFFQVSSSKCIVYFSYKHAFDGLIRVYREEGVKRLFGGASTATSRAVLMTIGQLSFYDQVKLMLISSGYFEDNLGTHFLSSLTAVRHYNRSLHLITY